MARHAEAYYANLTHVESWEFTLSHGPFPSTGEIVVTPHTDVIPARGDFRIRENTGTDIQLRDCATERAALVTEGGQLWSILFVDRRWRWKFGQVDGLYNLPISKGRYERRKTPRELIQICLDAIDERGVDLSAVPTDVFPLVEWHGTRPDEALGWLLDELGLRIVLTPQDRTFVVRANQGALLPALGLEKNIQLQIQRGSAPDALRALCASVRYQVPFSMEAVGEDTDGRIKLIDDLSYRPAAGWGTIAIPDFSAVKGTYQLAGKPVPRSSLAKRSVFKMYRIRSVSGQDDFTPPGYRDGAVQKRDLVLPLFDELNETQTDSDGIERQRPAFITGTFYPFTFVNQNAAPGTLYDRNWRLDENSGLVLFSDYVFMYSQNGTSKIPADLTLTCTCEVTNEETGVKPFHRVDAPLARPVRTEPMLVSMPELIPRVTGADNNFADIRKQAIERLQKAAFGIGGSVGGSVVYAGIHAISPDGAIQQVRWSGGRWGFFTSASRNMEVHIPLLAHDQRLARMKQKRIATLMERAEKRKAARKRRRAQRVQTP